MLTTNRFYRKNQLLFLVFFGLFNVTFAVFLLESLYSPGSINIFLLARIERMAHRADLCVDFFNCATGFKGVTAAAMNYHFIVFWMYPFFHNCDAPKYLIYSILSNISAHCNRILGNLKALSKYRPDTPLLLIIYARTVKFVRKRVLPPNLLGK